MASLSRRNTIQASQQSSSIRSSQSSHRFTNNTSKRSVAFDPKVEKSSIKKQTVQVFDSDNVDVTPRSLLHADANSLSNKSSAGGKNVINFSDSASVSAPSDLLNQSMFGGSTFQNSYAAGFSKSIMSSMISSRTSLDSVTDEISEPTHQTYDSLQESESKSDAKETLTAEDLEKVVYIKLEETDTITLLDIPDLAVSVNDENAKMIIQRNKKYDELCANREGNDRYAERGMQTFNNAYKAKDMQTTPVEVVDTGCMATNWDLYDTYNVPVEVEEGEDAEEDLISFSSTGKKSSSQKSVSGSFAASSRQSGTGMSHAASSVLSESSIFSTGSATFDESEEGSVVTHAVSNDIAHIQMEKIMKLDSFIENLFIMERMVVQNQYNSRQAAYRGIPDLRLMNIDDTLTMDEEEEVEESQPVRPNLSKLWSYECPFTRGMTVTCMVLNPINPDLIAVGYSKNGFIENGKGLICVWSIKNLVYPERIYVPSCAVTSMDFSTSHPCLLSVGLFNGTIVIYNIQNSVDKSILDSIDCSGKHSGPIWQLRWVEREKGTSEERGEILVSASDDGRVTQWSIHKGFEFSDLMKLKRTCLPQQMTKKPGAGKKNDAFISRFTSGLCFDFHPEDGNIYLAGTEDGQIHRCSCSYNEQYLESYCGHKGPVYRTLWSPYNSNIFLSCSADWSIRLWHIDKLQPILTFQASTYAVIDIDWCPTSPVIFAAITEKQVEIWDLTHSILDPLVVHFPVTHVKLSSVKFALNSKSLIVGDSEGHTTVYQLNEINLGDFVSDDEVIDESHGRALMKIVESNMPQTSRVYQVDDENSSKEFVER